MATRRPTARSKQTARTPLSGAKKVSPPKGPAKKRPAKKEKALTARTADRHQLYEDAVQNPEADLDFAARVFRRLRGRPMEALREDFCGTGYTCAEWVKRSTRNTAVGLDLDASTLEWGMKRHIARLSDEERGRVRLLRRNVLKPGKDASDVDAVFAMNFSYWIFKTRADLKRYFEAVRGAMRKDGVFFLDHYGGWEAVQKQTDRKRCKGFTYLWEQHSFNPLTFDAECRIHFEFRDGTALRSAFVYPWRMWQIPEVREILEEAGFRRVRVFWEGDDDSGGGDGVYREVVKPENCPVHLAYIVAER